MKPDVRILSNPEELARSGAQLLVNICKQSVATKGNFTIALSGGSTPRRLYQLLADPGDSLRSELPWQLMHFFWSDERTVGPNHPDSNYRMVLDAMLAHVNVPEANVHRIQGERTPAEAAKEYESELVNFFGLAEAEVPQFDLILLGMGTDGHTASLFPGSDALNDDRHLVAAPWVEKLNSYRITMTLPTLNKGSAVVFLVSGKEKAKVLRAVLRGEPTGFPAQAIQPTSGELTWLVDTQAASDFQEE